MPTQEWSIAPRTGQIWTRCEDRKILQVKSFRMVLLRASDVPSMARYVDFFSADKVSCLGCAWGLGGGRRWEQPGAAQEQPSSLEQPRELWNSSRRDQGKSGHLENDMFGSEPWASNFASDLSIRAVRHFKSATSRLLNRRIEKESR